MPNRKLSNGHSGWYTAILFICPVVTAACSIQPSSAGKAELSAFVSDKVARVGASQEPLDQPIDLQQAIARVLKYNLDRKVEGLNLALANKELHVATERSFPSLVAGSAYARRDADYALSSRSTITGQQSLEPSISQERSGLAADLSISWSILDFGLSYVRAQQAADAALIAAEMRRKTTVRLVGEVRNLYWRAVAHQRMTKALRRVRLLIEKAVPKGRPLIHEDLPELEVRRAYLESLRDIRVVVDQLAVSKIQLANLLDAPPGTDLQLVEISHALPKLDELASRSKMIDVALHGRPEIKDILYRGRINVQEVNAALLELLPGLQLQVGENFDNNPFLSHHSWAGLSTRVGWNLVKLAQYPSRRDSIRLQGDVLDQKAVAMAAAVILQVDVGRIKLKHAVAHVRSADELLSLQKTILTKTRDRAGVGENAQPAIIQEEIRLLWASIRSDLSYAQLQSSVAALNAAMGVDSGDANFQDPLTPDKLASIFKSKSKQGRT